MLRRDLLKRALPLAAAAAFPSRAIPEPLRPSFIESSRSIWLSYLERVATPVLEALAHGRLKQSMPIECADGMEVSRSKTTYLEAVGRLLSGVAPWLELGTTTGPEKSMHTRYVGLAQQAIAVGLDTRSPDALEFAADPQNLVDAAFLSLALLRAPTVLRRSLEANIRAQLTHNLRATRKFTPPRSNWLLFSACIEAALHALESDWDRARVDEALREHAAWYVGDGIYGDGPRYHADYYNSFVIHPFLLAVLEQLRDEDTAWAAMLPVEHARARRYAAIQERSIAPDGSYAAIGRSITYRCGAFHALADIALRQALPQGVTPASVRCALTAVLSRTLDPPGTFDAKGWLQIGLAGHQPALGETYISTGSLYLCAEVFLPLGLEVAQSFWTGPETPWASRRIWAGENLSADHAIVD